MLRTFGPSKGNRRPPHRLPGSRGAPAVQQGGSSMPTRHYAPSGAYTYSTPPVPTSTVPSKPRGPRPPVSATVPTNSILTDPLRELLEPGHTVKQVAEAALRLGVEPQKTPDLASAAVKALTHTVSGIERDVGKAAKEAIKLPHERVSHAFGHKTLGAPTVHQIMQAAEQRKLLLNRRGRVTVPATRKAARDLSAARTILQRSAQGPLGNLGPNESKIARIVLNTGRKMGATRKELLAAAETGLVESGFRNLHSGDASSEGWRQELATQYSDPTNVKDAARRFFEESPTDSGGTRGKGETAGQLAQQIQASAYPHRYDERKPEAAAILHDFLQNRGASDQARQQYAKAVQEAKSVGINPTPYNGDVGRQGETVFVRADARGMVQWVESALGTQEGSQRQVAWATRYGLGGSEPWCANFVSNGLSRRGVPLPPNPNYVPSYETEWSGGTNIGTDLTKAKPGDLIAFSGQHIGVYVGNGEIVSGNYGNQVARSRISEESVPVSAILRPHYEGGKVAVQAGSPLPGSSSGTAFAEPGGAVLASSGATPKAEAAKQRRLLAAMAPADIPPSALTAQLAGVLTVPGGNVEVGSSSELAEALQRLAAKKVA